MTSTTEDRQAVLSPGLAIKTPVRVSTSGNIALAGLQVVDAVQLVANDRVLVRAQTNPVDNGVYYASSGAWTRTGDFDGNRDLTQGTIMLVLEGATQAGKWYQLTTVNPIRVGSSALTFALSLTASISTLSFLAAGANAVPRTAQDKMRDIVSVKDFGAVGDGVADDTVAINNAFAFFAALLAITKGAMLFVPRGDYKLTGPITISLNNASMSKGTVLGEGKYASQFFMTGANIIFSAATLTHFTFMGLGFNNGTKGITFNTLNTDTASVMVRDCQFTNQSVVSLEAQVGSNSTQLLVDDCLFLYQTGGNQNSIISYCDYTRVRQTWIETNTTGSVIVNHGGNIEIDQLLGVPTGGSGATACWIENYTHCFVSRSRFGSEDAHGRPILWQKATISSCTVIIRDSFVPCDTFHYKFDHAPEILMLQGNYGYGALGGFAPGGFWFAAGSTADKGFMERGKWTVDDLEFPGGGMFADDGTNTASMLEIAWAKIGTNRKADLPEEIAFSEAISAVDGSARPFDLITTNLTVGTGAYPFLGGFTTKKLTCTANPGHYEGSNDLVTGTTNAGVVTFVQDVYVSGATRPFTAAVSMRNCSHKQVLYNGLNVICFQAQQDSASVTQQIDIFNIPNAAVILFGRMRLFAGSKNVRTCETIYTDLSTNTPPNNAFINHNKGDRAIFTDSPYGLQCVTAGQPGVFEREGPVRKVQTYSASMTIDAATGTMFDITANNGTAFTINAPTNPSDGRRMVVTIRNTSGGALGAATWNAVFKMSAWTNPANGNSRSIEFRYDGTNWVQINQTGVDVPN